MPPKPKLSCAGCLPCAATWLSLSVLGFCRSLCSLRRRLGVRRRLPFHLQNFLNSLQTPYTRPARADLRRLLLGHPLPLRPAAPPQLTSKTCVGAFLSFLMDAAPSRRLEGSASAPALKVQVRPSSAPRVHRPQLETVHPSARHYTGLPKRAKATLIDRPSSPGKPPYISVPKSPIALQHHMHTAGVRIQRPMSATFLPARTESASPRPTTAPTFALSPPPSRPHSPGYQRPVASSPSMSDGGRWVPPNQYSYGLISRNATRPGPLNPVGVSPLVMATGSAPGLARYAERQRQRVESEKNARRLVGALRSTPLQWSDAGYNFGRAPPPPSRASLPKSRPHAGRPQPASQAAREAEGDAAKQEARQQRDRAEQHGRSPARGSSPAHTSSLITTAQHGWDALRPVSAPMSDKALQKWAEGVHRWHALRCGERPEGSRVRRSQPREIMAETAEELFQSETES